MLLKIVRCPEFDSLHNILYNLKCNRMLNLRQKF